MRFARDESDRHVAILQVDASLNEEAGGDVVALLERLIDEGVRKLIVDGTSLSYISSGGLSILIRLHHRMRKRGGDMMLAGFHGDPMQALVMTRLDRVFQVHADLAEARAAFQSHQPV